MRDALLRAQRPVGIPERPPPAQPSPIHEALEEMKASGREVILALQHVAERLAPVLRPDATQESVPASRPPACCPLIDQLETMTQTHRLMTAALHNIMDRLVL